MVSGPRVPTSTYRLQFNGHFGFKDATEIILVWKNLILHRKEHTRGINEVNNGKRAFEGYALRANDFLRRLRKESARFYGRVIRNNHARNALDVAYASDYSSRRNLSPLFVHFVSRPEADLEEWRLFVE